MPDRARASPVQLVQVAVVAAIDHVVELIGRGEVAHRVARGLGRLDGAGEVIMPDRARAGPVEAVHVPVGAPVEHELLAGGGVDVRDGSPAAVGAWRRRRGYHARPRPADPVQAVHVPVVPR